ncbi:hypothetical protein GcM3_114018, partial [Golovinomyces cichoracearum]
MTTESDPSMTRITVVLDKPDDWYNWLLIRKDSCRRHDIWRYVDPDNSKDSLPQLTEPTESHVTMYKTGATTLSRCTRQVLPHWHNLKRTT